VSKLEGLVVTSAARLGVDELALLLAVILLLLMGGAALVFGTHLFG
jgi:hypothetical protein